MTFGRLRLWARQFPSHCQHDLLRLAASLRFVSKDETIKSLVESNREVLRRLRADGVPMEHVIYVTTDTAGSSSGVMLNLLRDQENLGRRGVHFLHSRDADGIRQKAKDLQYGAIIYVDDFAGTGRQFTQSRRAVAEEVVAGFSEFLLVVCICEEAAAKVRETPVEALATITHMRSERPLLEQSDLFTAEQRGRLVALSREHWGFNKPILGFRDLATNVVFYTNAPNTTPLLLRGHLGQHPLRGIVPRFDDLPVDDGRADAESSGGRYSP